MRKLLKRIGVLQEVSNKGRTNKLGRGFSTAYRLRPYNPLSYVVILITLILGLIMFGFVGIKKEIKWKNPFKWD